MMQFSVRSRSHWALAGWLLALPLASSAFGHDFWLQPTVWSASTGKTSCVELRVGDNFKGEIVHREPDYVDRFVARVPESEDLVEVKALPGRPHPAGWLRPTAAGMHAFGYQSKPRFLELHPIKFREYLLEEALTDIVQERSRLGEQETPGREDFIRCAKSLVEVAGDSAAEKFVDKPLGLSLEFVALDDPMSCAELTRDAAVSTPPRDNRWRVQLLKDGKPVVAARVRCVSKAADNGRSLPQVVTTDKEGCATFDLSPGRTWLVTCVQMTRADQGRKTTDPSALGKEVHWVSHWASLTFRS
jgi:uncharacterized GH25 family protein